ncbi:MAG: general secretion pathway protein GspB [Pseudomonadaceae bacterium]|nr:general secretion pathway protein GspB [Pseudomonadaceae bacterium]
MSYILDALNKQEGEVQNTANQPGQFAVEPSKRSWLPVLALALIANAIIVGIWLWQKPAPEQAAQDNTSRPATMSEDTSAAPQTAAQISAAPTLAAPTLAAPTLAAGADPVRQPDLAQRAEDSKDDAVTTFADMPTPDVEPLTATRPASSARPTPQAKPPGAVASTANASDQLTITTQPGEVVISPPGARPIIIEEGVTSATETPTTENQAQTLSQALAPSLSQPPEQIATPAATPREPANTPTFIQFAELDGATKARFPPIDVSTHIYAEDTDLRAVVFESRRLQEGDTIAGLPLLHITETGLVVRFEGKLIEISVLDDWEGY